MTRHRALPPSRTRPIGQRGGLVLAAASIAPPQQPAPSPVVEGASPNVESKAPLLAAALLAIIGARVHEVFPFLAPLKPALLTSVVGVVVLWRNALPQWRIAATSDPVFQIAAAYAAWAVLTAPLALWPGLAVKSSIYLFIPALLLILALLLCAPTERNRRLLAIAFVGACALHASFVIITGQDLSGETRLSGLGGLDPNDFASLMAMAFPFAVMIAARAKGWRRLVGAGSVLICVAMVVLSGSRGGVLALAVGAMMLAISAGGLRTLGYGALFVVGAVLLWSFGPETFRTRMESLRNVKEDYNYTVYEGRKQVWARGRIYIRQHPVMGVGMSNFPVAEGNYLESLGRHGKWSAAHSAYIQVFAELGIPGGTLFVALLLTGGYRAFVVSRRRWRPDLNRYVPGNPEYLAALIAFTTGAYFLSHAYFYAMFGVVGMTALAYRVRRGEVTTLTFPISGGALLSAFRSARRVVP